MLNPSSLQTQLFTIRNDRDTVLKTAQGAVINIKSGSFSGAEDEVKLEVKEAYDMADIISAGLTTQSDGKPLRSGGMIYLDAADDNVSIVRPIEVSVPSDSYEPSMMLFKGSEEEGKMNWTEPEPLKDSMSPYLLRGKTIFDANCALCHGYDKELTGPAMRGLEGRGPWGDRKELITFTRNPAGYIPKTCYTKNLVARYNGQIMPSFPQLSDKDLNAVYDYIKSRDIVNGVDLTNNYRLDPCEDSCYRYDSVRWETQSKINALHGHRKALIQDNEDRINYERWDSTGIARMEGVENGTIAKVVPDNYKAIYYRFDIKSFGWYNIDALLDATDADAGKLVLQVDNSLSEEWDVFIAVPGQKVFDRGGKLANKKDYGFFTLDGKIPLKAGTPIVVFVLGEADAQIAFDYKEVVTTGNDVIKLNPQLSTKEAFNKAVKSWSMKKVTIEAADSKNAAAIRKADAEIETQKETIEQYRPKNCNCNCGELSDTTNVHLQ